MNMNALPSIGRFFFKTKKSIVQLKNNVQGRKCSLPHFLIIGAAKAGTTSLYAYLTQHPQVLKAKGKEIQFFSTRYKNGIMWYRSHFPPLNEVEKGYVTGEASPYYLFHPHSAERIFQLLPNIKMIVLLRDPVDRAISHYFDKIKKGEEFLSIEDALHEEEKRVKPELIKMRSDQSYNSEIHRGYSYKLRGIYADQLAKYLDYFKSNQILVIKSEELFSSPREVLRSVFDFLAIETNFLPKDLSPKNVGDYSTKVSDSVYKELINYYAPHNEKLYQLVGRDFGWKTP